MKRYFVKETSISTKDNPRGANIFTIAIMGKQDEMLKYESTSSESLDFDHMWFMAEEYGYKRICDAKRNWTFNNPENSKFWTSKVEIIEVDMYSTGYYTEKTV